MIRIAKRLSIGLIGLLLLVLLTGNAYRLYGEYRVANHFPAPGEMVDIGTHKMHMYCLGSGQPTVVLDAGTYDFSAAWGLVLEGVETTSRICAYDRSGRGWSEVSPAAPSVASRVEELEALLRAAHEPRPYILVGHALGASFAWMYAQSHMEDTVGVVTADAIPPRFSDILALGGDSPTPSGIRAIVYQAVDSLGLTALLSRFQPSSDMGPEFRPEWARNAMNQWRHLLSPGRIEELMALPSYAEEFRGMAGLSDVPLIVISHGMTLGMFDSWGTRAEEAEQRWQAEQAELASRSSRGQLIIADRSGHGIIWMQPEVVAEAIQTLVEEYRNRQSATAGDSE